MKRIITTPLLLAMLLGIVQPAKGVNSFIRGDGKRLIDIVISIYESPEGDDDGDTQDINNLSEQDKIEQTIQYFADGIYESTEGMHLLRNVYIFKSKANWHNCDIQWSNNEKSFSTSLASNFLGKKIKACYLPTKKIFFSNNKDREICGHGMAHEWAHYFLGLYDEYETFAPGGLWKSKIKYYECVFPSIMNMHDRAVQLNDFKHLNFSVRYRGGPDWNVLDNNGNPKYGEFENTKLTAHHFMFGKSAWETLSDPDTSDSSGIIHARWLGKRTYYPELSTVAPVGDNLPRTDLIRGGPYPSRDELKIHWIAAKSVVQLVIDRSGSMDGEPLKAVQRAARAFVDLADVGTSIGIISFNQTATVAHPIITITNSTSKQPLFNAIANLKADGNTDVAAAMRLALSGLENFGATNKVAAVFVLTDGGHGWDVGEPQKLIDDYNDARIPIYAFYGGYELATGTGGNYYSGLDPISVYWAMVNAYFDISMMSSILLHFTPVMPPFNPFMMNETPVINPAFAPQSLKYNLHCPFLVESNMTNLFIHIMYEGAISNATLQLRSPGNTIITPTTLTGDNDVFVKFNLVFPTPGEWTIEGTYDPGVEFLMLGCVKTDSDVWFHVSAPEQDNDHVWVLARLEKDGVISGMNVTGKMNFNGNIIETQVFDEVMPGRYVAKFNRVVGKSGIGRVTVTVDNSLGKGVETWKEFIMEEEEESEWEDIPIPEDFLRISTVVVDMRQQTPVDLYDSVLYVNTTRPHNFGDGRSWATAKKTIQAAVDVANNSTTILVANGFYEHVNVGNKPLTILSVNGPDFTIINGRNANQCVILNPNTFMNGFTLKNG